MNKAIKVTFLKNWLLQALVHFYSFLFLFVSPRNMLLLVNWVKQQILLMPLAVWSRKKTLVNAKIKKCSFKPTFWSPLIIVNNCVLVIFGICRSCNQGRPWGEAESFYWGHNASSSTVSIALSRLEQSSVVGTVVNQMSELFIIRTLTMTIKKCDYLNLVLIFKLCVKFREYKKWCYSFLKGDIFFSIYLEKGKTRLWRVYAINGMHVLTAFLLLN